MAIQFARIEIVSRSSGSNACCKGAYNARVKIQDEQTNRVYNFQDHGDNVYHKILLPEHVDKKFNSVSKFMNEVERAEKRKDSQLLKDIVLALPDDKELTLQDRINITHLLIGKKGWVKEGLGVQVDIHSPHDGEKNWHAHLLVTTRRFTKDGLTFGAKATDLNPEFKKARHKAFVVPETEQIHTELKDIINDYFKDKGLDNRVDAISLNPQEHIGPVRMRSVMNAAIYRNEERAETGIEHLNNGEAVLDKITAHMSIFNRKDLERAVKIVPDSTARERLVEDALSSKSLIALYDEGGRASGYCTTSAIREEEEKLLRLSSYVVNQKNVVAARGNNLIHSNNHQNEMQQLLDKSSADFTEEQQKALAELLFGESGLRILRGRAGTGKSHVLGKLGNIARESGINVIGIAPTHKAKNELSTRGYDQTDTIKGMLFKLANGRFELPKHSLLVVDEAGMIGNDDFKELLRIAASRKCNVILSGDEKQLASVQRGGMFEVFSDRYGSSSILNIQRQQDAWGREVAMAFSAGEVKSGISILQENNKIIEKSTQDESMQGLLADWSKSAEKLTDRLILAVKNIDVAALNHGARQYLKQDGILQGAEIVVAGNHYMKNDRILIAETNKELGLVNGDFATVIDASKERFVVRLEDVQDKGDQDDKTIGGDSGVRGDKEDKSSKQNQVNDNSRLVAFNPTEYRGFRHGYATTIFKSQGASIKDVYVFHDGFAGMRNSYVALSRHVKELGLYTNNRSTKSVAHLTKQLGHDPEKGSSLSYLSRQDIANREIAQAPTQDKNIVGNLITRAARFASEKITALADKHIPASEYYNYKAPELKREKVEAVLDIVAKETSQEAIGNVISLEERAVVGSNSNPNIVNYGIEAKNSSSMSSVLANEARGASGINRVRQSAKERFYAKADYVRKAANNLAQKAKWDSEAEQLRMQVRFKTESIARDLLGEPNKNLSNGRTLRFGEHGRVAVRISGERMGSWYDFAEEKGGDMFALVQDKQGCDFKGAADYLRRNVGMEPGNNSHLQLVDDHSNRDLTAKHIKARAEEERINKAKAEQVEKLYARAKDIGNESVAHKYLTKHRGLDVNIALSADIKSTGIYVRSNIDGDITEEAIGSKKGKYLPAIIGFARDTDGNVTGGQQILLNKTSGHKANVDIPKKSFGRIAGSFVSIGIAKPNLSETASNIAGKERITIIAEGLETALSVKQALREHSNKHTYTKTLCSLGISNIKNYPATPGEKIVIAADNDGTDSFTNKTIERAKLVLEEKGAFVEIVKPAKEGDFNDVLKSDGSKAISKAFESALVKHTATTLKEYLAQDSKGVTLDANDMSNLAYIEKYDLPQEAAINAFRRDKDIGLEELRKTKECAESISKDMTFLVDQNVKTKEQLLEDIKHTQDIKSTAEDLREQCQKYSGLKLSMAQMSVSINDNNGQEDKSLQEMLKIQTCIKDISPYLSKVEMMRVEHFENRLKVYDIYEQHKEQNPVEAQRFKDEMQSLNRFTTSGNTKDALQCYAAQDIAAATTFAQKANYDSVIFKLSRRFHIVRSDKTLNEKDYIDAVAKDSQIMRYIDIARASGNKFVSPDPKDNNLLDYANQRDVFNLVETIKPPNDIYLFQSSIEDMQKYSNREDLKLAIEIYKNQGLKHFDERTDIMCSTAIEDKIKHDIRKIRKGEAAKDFNQTDCMDEKKYLCAISNDQSLTRYINPTSDIGKEIEEQKQMSNGFELDR